MARPAVVRRAPTPFDAALKETGIDPNAGVIAANGEPDGANDAEGDQGGDGEEQAGAQERAQTADQAAGEAPAPDPDPLAAEAVPAPAMRLIAAIDAYDRSDLAVQARLENLRAAAGDFLRVAAELPERAPPELRALVASITERI